MSNPNISLPKELPIVAFHWWLTGVQGMQEVPAKTYRLNIQGEPRCLWGHAYVFRRTVSRAAKTPI